MHILSNVIIYVYYKHICIYGIYTYIYISLKCIIKDIIFPRIFFKEFCKIKRIWILYTYVSSLMISF